MERFCLGSRNKAFRRLGNNPVESQIKKLRAKARRVMRDAKKRAKNKDAYFALLNQNQLWRAGLYGTSTGPVSQSEGQEAVDNKAKADMPPTPFQTVQSEGNIMLLSKQKEEGEVRD